MEIDNPKQLDALGKLIANTRAEKEKLYNDRLAKERAYREVYPIRGALFGYDFPWPSAEDFNKIYSAMPEQIIITPRIAYFLSSKDLGYKKKESSIDRKQARQFLNTYAHGIALMLFPNPHSATAFGVNIANRLIKGRDYETEMENFLKSRDKTVLEVLGAYSLKGSISNGFRLNRGNWIKGTFLADNPYGRGNAYETRIDIVGTGLDKDFNFDELEQFITENIDKGASNLHR